MLGTVGKAAFIVYAACWAAGIVVVWDGTNEWTGNLQAGEAEVDDALIQTIRGLLEDPDRDMRALGLQQIREEVPGRAATERFAAMLPELPPEVQVGLLEALGDRGDPAARPAVLKMVSHNQEAVRAAAIKALGTLGSLDDVPLLAEKAEAGSPQEKQAAFHALRRLPADQVNSVLVKLLKEGSPARRAVLLSVLAARNARQVMSEILPFSLDEDPAVRSAAIGALRQLADQSHTPALVEALCQARNAEERWQAELALLSLASRFREQCTPALLAGLAKADAENRQALLRVVARAGGQKTIPTLLAHLEDPAEAVRDEAVRMLCALKDGAVVEHLERLAQSGSLRHQILAERALIRLSGKPADRLRSLEAKARQIFGQSPQTNLSAPEPKKPLKLAPIQILLPAPAFRGTPVPLKEPNVEKPLGKPRPPFLAPEGTRNLALGKPVRASDPAPSAGELDYVTDGQKEASDFALLELRPGSEWVQIDLGHRATVYAILIWHNHAEARVYRDVIVQISDDPDFLVYETIFNNDHDNTSGLGVGQDKGYVETSEGKLIDARGLQGRYVRLWSRGNHIDDKNHYTEVEVFGTVP
ncbi:MAG: HEAT repeat domain-containing protein [Thermoguttaceae bacterium]|nr:HEAT repeat domain-containing protein [Thermoguttaceae bacterium]MDW8038898.1 HEAT repeat domain-containing protein [Thermoguttaceae bacterium]